MIQVEGVQNKTDSPLRAMEHGVLESEPGEKKKRRTSALRSFLWDLQKNHIPSESSSYPVSSEMGGEDDSLCATWTLVSVISMKRITQQIVSGEAQGWNQTRESCLKSLSEYQARIRMAHSVASRGDMDYKQRCGWIDSGAKLRVSCLWWRAGSWPQVKEWPRAEPCTCTEAGTEWPCRRAKCCSAFSR